MPEFEDLRSAVPGPTPEETTRARALLQDQIAYSRGWNWRPGHRWRAAIAGGVLVLATVVGWQVLTPPRAQAGLERIASAIEEIPFSELPAGTYHYVRIDQTAIDQFPGDSLPEAGVSRFAVRVESIREVWVAEDGSIVERVTSTSAEPLDTDLVQAFESSGIPESLGVGTTTTAAYPPDPNRIPPDMLPTNQAELEDWMRGEVGSAEADEYPARLLDVALQLLTDPASPPKLRAAVLRVLGSIEGLVIEELGTSQEVKVTAAAPAGDKILERSIQVTQDGRVSQTSLSDVVGDPSINVAPRTVVEQSHFQYASPVTDIPI